MPTVVRSLREAEDIADASLPRHLCKFCGCDSPVRKDGRLDKHETIEPSEVHGGYGWYGAHIFVDCHPIPCKGEGTKPILARALPVYVDSKLRKAKK